MLAFGPVPSRRLGRSIGINNIPPKICSYSCIYCQLGRSLNMSVERMKFYEPERILRDVKKKIKGAERNNEHIDYLTFVPDGEPTLDLNLGVEIRMLKNLGIKIAVITNSSLIWREDVRRDLELADWVSVKIDSVDEKAYRRINRPHPSLKLADIMGGIVKFSERYKGELVTESMLVKGVNDKEEYFKALADFLGTIKLSKAYISIPTRPTAEGVKPPDEETINLAYQILSCRVKNTEYLIGYEGNSFAFTGNIKEDILSITAVHPMREEAVREFLKKADGKWDVIEELVREGKLIKTSHEGKNFYVRRFGRRQVQNV